MELKLDALNIVVENPYVEENDVFVDFEFDKVNLDEIKFYLNVLVGKKESDCRFSMKSIYIVDVRDEVYDDENKLVRKCVEQISESLIEMILILDNLIKKPKERLH